MFVFISHRKIGAFTKNVENLDRLVGNFIKMMIDRDDEAMELSKDG